MAKNQNRANASRNAAALRARFKAFDEAYQYGAIKAMKVITSEVASQIESDVSYRAWVDDTGNLRASTGIGAYRNDTLVSMGVPNVVTTQKSRRYKSNRIYPDGHSRLLQALAGGKGAAKAKNELSMKVFVAQPYGTAVNNYTWEVSNITWFQHLRIQTGNIIKNTWAREIKNTKKAIAERSRDSKGRFI